MKPYFQVVLQAFIICIKKSISIIQQSKTTKETEEGVEKEKERHKGVPSKCTPKSAGILQVETGEAGR